MRALATRAGGGGQIVLKRYARLGNGRFGERRAGLHVVHLEQEVAYKQRSGGPQVSQAASRAGMARAIARDGRMRRF